MHFIACTQRRCNGGDGLAEMTPFNCGDFYDVPHLILLQYRGSDFLLCCSFDEKFDDYGDRYDVYRLSNSDLLVLREDGWERFIRRPLKRVGDIAVRDVKFDSTRRKELDASCLSSFLVET